MDVRPARTFWGQVQGGCGEPPCISMSFYVGWSRGADKQRPPRPAAPPASLYFVQMVARCPVAAAHFLELRHLGGAALVGVGAAGAETAAARRIQRAGHIALQHDTVALAGRDGVRHGNGRNQAAGVGVDAVGDQLKAVGQLHHLAQIHNADAVGNVLDNAQVVGDEQVGQPHLLLQVLKHVDDLRLDRNVQRGDRLVADDELGVHSQGAGDADALALTAGELVRVAVGVLTVQADALEQGDDLVMALLGVGAQVVDVDALADDVADGHTGVQARVGVLEHDLHAAAVGQHINGDLFLFVKQDLAVVDDGAVGRLIQAQQGAARRGLAAAGLTDQAQRLALADGKAHVVHGLNVLLVLAHAAGGEILLQMLYFNEILAHQALPPFSNSSFWRSQQ